MILKQCLNFIVYVQDLKLLDILKMGLFSQQSRLMFVVSSISYSFYTSDKTWNLCVCVTLRQCGEVGVTTDKQVSWYKGYHHDCHFADVKQERYQIYALIKMM